MPRNRIPKRDPVSYGFTGSLLHYTKDDQDIHALMLTTQSEHTDLQLVASGKLLLRYGFRYYGKPHFSITPGIVALDYGDMLTGQEAWDFVYSKSNLHPRADIVGYRNDGLDEMIPLKTLDLAVTPAVLIYADAQATVALAEVDVFIAPEDVAQSADLPPKLLEFIPHYNTVDDFLATL